MGGRGGSSGIVKTQSLDQFLGERGLSSPVSDFMLDKLRIPHGLTKRQEDKLQQEADKARIEYSEKRQSTINEYNDLVSKGKIRLPGKYDALIHAANGHPDNPSTQAARRALDKRGIDWKTGKKKRKKKT